MISKELIGASAKPLVLSVLAQGEDYGYSIIQRVRQLSEDQIEWTEGMLYPVLHRMEKEGLLVSSWQVGDSGRKRKYYRLSKTGAKSIAREQAQWIAVHNTLAKLWGMKPCTT
ncbi:MAG: helix-turn-helix transcriptional regulator [Planctomycetales bacterium]|nr:helix-turn-helix transcriptional regulator [Planctomycetales bacterium]